MGDAVAKDDAAATEKDDAAATEVGRFAPSTTGEAHPGTLMAALLCWLDARSRGARVVLRLEDLDPQRSRSEWIRGLIDHLDWLGLDWDAITQQSAHGAAHARALDLLAAAGLLYPCACGRAELRAGGQRSPDGGWRYPGTCRENALPRAGWRAVDAPLRVRLPEGVVELRDESGTPLSADPLHDFGDPIARRRDGSIAYHLASVVDDAEAGVTRVVRGVDLATSTPTQVCLQRLLGLPTPTYRHHLLLLEGHGDKLAKLHGAVGAAALRQVYDAPQLVGWLALAAGLRPAAEPLTPADLLADFDWQRVRAHDLAVRWTGCALELTAR